jgi:CubicO group peptidase (beta-lactamase class C family)
VRASTLALLALVAGCKSTSHPSGGADMAAKYDFTALHDYLFKTWQTEGVVVQYKGQIVYEEYAAGYTQTMPHVLYSASKSIGSALVGIAVDQGLMSVSDSVCKYITQPAGADPTLCDTSIEHLLHMSSGLTWAEDYTVDPSTSNVVQMLYGNEPDMAAYAAAQPRANPAGSVFSYSSGDANILSAALKGALAGKDPAQWAKDNLFTPLGLTSADCETDGAGTLVLSSWCYLSVRDFANFGQLYLDGGMHAGKKILPSSWITYTHTAAPADSTPMQRLPDAGGGYSGGSYGAEFWLNATSASAPMSTWFYPQAPVDTYSAEGHYGQKLMIVPSQQLVVARVANERDTYFDPGPMVQYALQGVGVQ